MKNTPRKSRTRSRTPHGRAVQALNAPMPSAAPQPSAAPKFDQFADLRLYLEGAVEQLLTDMREQQVAYAVPGGDVVALLRDVAKLRSEADWDVWEAWMLRHAVPVWRALRAPRTAAGTVDTPQVEVLRKRLMDLLGYCLLGLALCDHD